MNLDSTLRARLSVTLMSTASAVAAMVSCGMESEFSQPQSVAIKASQEAQICQDLIAQIGQLKPQGLLSSESKKCDTKDLAHAAVQRLYAQPHSHPKVAAEAQRIYRTGSVSKQAESAPVKMDRFEPGDFGVEIRFNPFILPLILQNGILNIHQVGMSLSASNNPVGRAALEDALIGLRLEQNYTPGSDNPFNALRPKYGYLSPNLERYESMNAPGGHHWRYFQNSAVENYGCLIARFNDDVKRRTTWTYGDSLAQFEEIQASTPSNDFSRWIDPPQTLLGPSQPVRVSPNRTIGYLEAQVWGELNVNDVGLFLIDESCGMDGLGSSPSSIEQLRSILKSTGKPIYLILPLDGTEDQSMTAGLQSLDGRVPLDPGRIVMARQLFP